MLILVFCSYYLYFPNASSIFCAIFKVELLWLFLNWNFSLDYPGYSKNESYDVRRLRQCCQQFFPFGRWLKVHTTCWTSSPSNSYVIAFISVLTSAFNICMWMQHSVLSGWHFQIHATNRGRRRGSSSVDTWELGIRVLINAVRVTQIIIFSTQHEVAGAKNCILSWS